MHGANEIIREAAELPIEERARVIDSLLKTFNPPEPEIDRQWVALAQRRLNELRSGAVRPIPVSEVFDRIRNRFGA
jgi:putative addiction module component (TIGR02574 family)